MTVKHNPSPKIYPRKNKHRVGAWQSASYLVTTLNLAPIALPVTSTAADQPPPFHLIGPRARRLVGYEYGQFGTLRPTASPLPPTAMPVSYLS